MTRVSGPTLSSDVLGGAPEALVQTALIAGGIGLWEWHVGSGALALSPHLETLLGYPTGGFDGASETFLARLVPVDRGRVEEAIAAAAANGSETDLELRVVDLTGVARWFAAKGRVLRDAAGKAVRIVGTMQEVPATVIAERRMRRQQAALLRLLVRGSHHAASARRGVPTDHRSRRPDARDRAHQHLALHAGAHPHPLPQALSPQYPAAHGGRDARGRCLPGVLPGARVRSRPRSGRRAPRCAHRRARDRLSRAARDRRDARGPGPARRSPRRGRVPRARRPAAPVAARREGLRRLGRRSGRDGARRRRAPRPSLRVSRGAKSATAPS